METAISDIAAAGYAGVEMFDGNVADYADQPAVLQGLLADAGLELVSVYSGGNFIYADLLDDELHRVTRAAALAQQFGAANLVVGGGAGEPPAPRTRTTPRSPTLSTRSPTSPNSTGSPPATTRTCRRSSRAPTNWIG